MDNLINQVFSALEVILPSDWERLVLHLATDESTQTVSFFVKGTGRYYSHSELERYGFFTAEEFTGVRVNIRKAVHPYWKTLTDPWTGFTLCVSHDGKFSMDCEYEEQPFTLPDSWKNKYLV